MIRRLAAVGFVGLVLAAPRLGGAQEASYTTVTGRLHPEVEVRVRLDPERHGERWFPGAVGHISVPTGPNLAACTTVAIPALSEDDGTFMVPLRRVSRLQVRRRGEEVWTPLELEALLEAEPEPCQLLEARASGELSVSRGPREGSAGCAG